MAVIKIDVRFLLKRFVVFTSGCLPCMVTGQDRANDDFRVVADVFFMPL